MPFHFLPKRIRRESPKDFSYITERATGADSELATMLIQDAIEEGDRKLRLIRIGVALHTVADSFSHFGFSGRLHDENDVGTIWHATEKGKWKRQILESYIYDIFAPKVGHAEAFKFPDKPFLHWRYKNYKGKMVTRNNVHYSVQCARLIYRFLKMAKSSTTTSDLDKDHPADFKKIRSLFKIKGDLDKRCRLWKNYTNLRDYDKTKLRRAALKGDVDWDLIPRSDFAFHMKRLKGKAGFDDSKWASFHRAAFKQRFLVLGWIN
jgi:hypothetical protein